MDIVSLCAVKVYSALYRTVTPCVSSVANLCVSVTSGGLISVTSLTGVTQTCHTAQQARRHSRFVKAREISLSGILPTGKLFSE